MKRVQWVSRDAVFRVLAVEQPQATVLNYAPGPLDTPMISELLADTRTDPGERCCFHCSPHENCVYIQYVQYSIQEGAGGGVYFVDRFQKSPNEDFNI
jgi:hypothetical protein